jgi:hypothetical protein
MCVFKFHTQSSGCDFSKTHAHFTRGDLDCLSRFFLFACTSQSRPERTWQVGQLSQTVTKVSSQVRQLKRVQVAKLGGKIKSSGQVVTREIACLEN